jgi:RNA polymerase-associated protein RTF1
MSDFGDDIDDELLELAGASEKKRKKRQASSSKLSAKRRKADVSSSSDDGPESEEEESTTPYPLEGKYVDEADRQRLMQLPEIEREKILGERLEDMQRIQDKRNLDQMLKAQTKGVDSESVSKAAKRQHPVKGATKEKTRKLDELRAKRKAKDEKKRTKNSPRRDRSSSPMDMETDSEDEEDGQISKLEEEEEKDRKRYGKPEAEEEPITLEDLSKCRLTRELLVKYWMAPWFEEYVKGAWVRYLIGQENGETIYRICEITSVSPDPVKPYKIDDKSINQLIELKHGKSARLFMMDKVSNSALLPKEFERLQIVCQMEGVKLPTKAQIEIKSAQLAKFATQPMTESDITAILARKNNLQAGKPSAQFATMERSPLNQARTLALRRQDYTEVEVIDQQLSELPAVTTREEDISDMLAKVNERNRKANLEAVRKAELQETERKRRERKAQAARAAGTPTPQDPSARLKTVPKLFNSLSRPGTPKSNAGTPLLLPQQAGGTTRSISPLPPSALSGRVGSPDKFKTFEASVIDSIEVDLGDF